MYGMYGKNDGGRAVPNRLRLSSLPAVGSRGSHGRRYHSALSWGRCAFALPPSHLQIHMGADRYWTGHVLSSLSTGSAWPEERLPRATSDVGLCAERLCEAPETFGAHSLRIMRVSGRAGRGLLLSELPSAPATSSMSMLPR